MISANRNAAIYSWIGLAGSVLQLVAVLIAPFEAIAEFALKGGSTVVVVVAKMLGAIGSYMVETWNTVRGKKGVDVKKRKAEDARAVIKTSVDKSDKELRKKPKQLKKRRAIGVPRTKVSRSTGGKLSYPPNL